MSFLYKTGLYGGTFDPLHMGHVDCILKAASMCRELYIVLSVSLHRAEVEQRVRYRWLYQLTEHLHNVRILMMEDNSLTKADYSTSMALQDAEGLRAQIGKPVEAVFFGSDYGPDSFWYSCWLDSEHIVFERNEISSTELRRDIYGHFDWLPQIVRPYYTKKVLLIGGESTGKSTLTINLARHFNTNYVEEAGRDISERSGTDTLMLLSDYTDILLQHKMNEIAALSTSNRVLFIDTDALVTQFYFHFLEGENTERLEALSDAIDGLNNYDLILFLEPDVEFVQDGGRSEIIHAERVKYSEQIRALLDSHGRKYVRVGGSYLERFEKAVGLVEKLLTPTAKQA